MLPKKIWQLIFFNEQMIFKQLILSNSNTNEEFEFPGKKGDHSNRESKNGESNSKLVH